jgi:RimJ/RimL family protein N-acetyltransferase
VRLEDIDQNPELASNTIVLPTDEQTLLRPLRRDDAEILSTYFLGLSSETTRVYGPHPFDQETADRLCRDLDSADHLRMLAIVEEHGMQRIVAYFIVHFGVYESDHNRYEQREMPLDPTVDCELAPSVADAYQGSGVGSLVMGHLLPLLKRAGRQRLALVGGVRAENLRAIHFYEKFGFRKVGEFKSRGDIDNFDMIADL